MAENLTYVKLVEQILSYCEKVGDSKLTAQIPFLVMLAENRIAADFKQQGFQSVVTGEFTVGAEGATFAKPAFWRETISFTYKHPTEGWRPVRLRALEYLKTFWPVAAVLEPPRFYADYNATNFFVAPSPNLAYEFELAYYARLQPLDADHEENWLTRNAPQMLLYASLLEANMWLKNADKSAFWAAQYETQKASLLQENAERINDKTQTVTRG